MDKVALLQPISFKYNRLALNDEKVTVIDSSGVVSITETNSQSFYDQTRYGFSAQEVQKIFPDLVTEDEKSYLAIDYIGLIPVLVKALKEQQIKIEELENKVAKLSGIKPK